MGFDKRSTAMDVTEGLDLSGKTIVITGVNSGLGEESMRVLCLRGAHVLGLARSIEKAEAACEAAPGQATGFACELGDFASVKACAEEIKALNIPIDALITNAGIMAPKKLSIFEGFESQYATNHLGHFILVHHLLDQLRAADRGRLVILSSAAHTMTVKGGINFDNLDAAQAYNPWRFYGQSKLANLLTARYLADALRDSGIDVNAVHPGVIKTNLGRDIGGLFSKVINLFAPFIEKSVEQGAATQCLLAVSPSVKGVTGEYFADCKVSRSTAAGRDSKLAQRLWEDSLERVADYL